MGGGLALVLAVQPARRRSRRCAPFYGVIPWPSTPSPTGRSSRHRCSATSPSKDGFFTPDKARALEAELKAPRARTAEFFIYDGADHAFFNDTRPEVYDAGHAAHEAWEPTVDFFNMHLG